MVHIKISSDLDLGRRPELESDEFLMFTILVNEILRCEDFCTAKKCYTFFGALPKLPHGTHTRCLYRVV